MLTELRGKGGCLCSQAKEGKLHCPLIVRPTSEDVITGDLIQVLRTLNPFWWLSDLLNEALGAPRFHRQLHRRLRIEPWQNQPPYPRRLLPWDEGSTQVDVKITWENRPTTVFLEAKYGSPLSPRTSGDDGQHGYPSDQLIRNARVGLLECGWFESSRLFNHSPRDFVLIVVSPRTGTPLVHRYRDASALLEAIPHSERLQGLPPSPFIGELSFRQIVNVLRKQQRWFNRAERLLVDDLTQYLEFKLASFPRWGKPLENEESKNRQAR
jgi:hypothetical protein